MRYLAGFVAVAALSLSSTASLAAGQVTLSRGASARPQTAVGGSGVNPAQAQITGKVIGPGGDPVADVTVRARDLLNGQIGGSTSTAAAGQFAVSVNPGSYILEVVDAGGQILGTGPFISAAAGTAVGSTITVTNGALSALASTGGLVSTLTTAAAKSVTYAAVAAGVAGVVTPGNVVTASPSR